MSNTKFDKREPALINKGDASKLGIKHGDLVEVYNDRGSIVCCAFLTDDIVPGVTAVAEGAWYCAENPEKNNSRCLSGQVNVLTSDRPTSRFAQAISANTCLVGIKKLKGIPPENTAYECPEILDFVK
ncbi:MAG: hypothetical protein LRY50_06370 [Geovibrio sp.]|nr:hypothetical protein [Geovibrio sp.]